MSTLRLIYNCLGGRSGEIVRERISELVASRRHCICIVPEQQTVIAEAAMAERLPTYAPLCFEVTNFSRLAETVFRKYGGISYNYASDTSRALIMWRTLAELSPLISEFSFSDPGSVQSALSAVADMRIRGITPPMLERVSQGMPESTLRKKLRDLAMIQTLSGALLREHYDDSYDDLDRLAELLSAKRALEGYHVFIDGFVSFTAQEYNVVRALCRQCELTVTLPLPSPGCDRLQFAEPLRFESDLRRIASDAGAEITEEQASFTSVPALVRFAADTVGDGSTSAWSGEGGGLRIVGAEDPYRASEFIACDILRRVQEQGASFSDFAVIVRDAGSYTGIVDSIFARYGIPFFLSAKTDLTSLEPIRLIRSAYSVVRGGWKQDDVVSFLKCGLSGISPDDCDELEDYAAKWHINGSRFTDGIAWNMNPDGYTAVRTAYGNALLARVNTTRESICDRLLPFSEALDGAQTVKDHCTALYEFLLSLQLPERLDARADEKERTGDTVGADEYRRLWKLICDSLDVLCDVLAEVDTDTDTFVRLLDIAFGDASLGRIPTRCDQVVIGAADMIRVDSPKRVYILGANKDEFPAAVNISGFFGDADRAKLRELGLDVGEDVGFLSSRELFYFYRALLFATEGVDIIHTEYGTMRTQNKPSGELLTMLELAGDAIEHLDASALPLEFYVRERRSAAELGVGIGDGPAERALREVLRRLGEDRTQIPLSIGERSLERGTAMRLFGESIHLSQSKISDFTECPFRFFGKYVLNLDPSQAAEINYRDIGNYVHRLLEIFFRTLDEEGRHLRDIPPDELPAIADGITKIYINEICPDGRAKTARLVRLFERLSRSALMILRELREEFAASDFDPTRFELSLRASDESAPDPLYVKIAGGGGAEIHGVIDRLDRYKKDGDVYLRVVDYKTGTHKFHYSNIASGTDLQLIIYLMAVTEGNKPEFRRLLGVADEGRIIPAGAICFTAGAGEAIVATPAEAEGGVDRARKSIVRSGILLDDEGVLAAMDGSTSGKFSPLKSTREGTKPTAGSLLLSTEGMTELFKTVTQVISGIGAEIRSGKISTAGHVKQSTSRRTLSQHCASCPMKPICRKPIRE